MISAIVCEAMPVRMIPVSTPINSRLTIPFNWLLEASNLFLDELEFKNSTQVSQYFRRQIIDSQENCKLVPCLLALVDDARGIVHQNVDLAGGRGL